MTTKLIDRETAAEALTPWLESLGLSLQASKVIVEHVISAELVGRRSHGLRLIPALARGVTKAAELPNDVTVLEQEAGTLAVDGSGLPGIYALDRAVDQLIEGHARGRLAMSAAVVRFAGTTGCLGLYAHRLAEAGLTGLVLSTSPSIMAPPGGTQPLLGTNAISFGAPTGGGNSVVGDFASSEATYGDVALARDQGTPVPLGVMLNQAGHPTTDPSEIVNGTLEPSGGHRGWCQALLVELFAGALTGGKVGRGHGEESALLLSFAQGTFFRGDATEAAADLVRQIRSTDAAPGGAPPHVPGERFELLGQPGSTLDIGLETLRRIEEMGGPTLG